MKNLIIPALFFILTISVFGQTSGQKSDKETKTEEEVKELANQFVNTLKKKDIALMEKILSDDYVDIGLFSGIPTTKFLVRRIFNESKELPLEIFTIDLDNSIVHLYGETAVVIGFAKVKWSVANNQEQSYMATLVIVKKNGVWQLAASHFSETKFQVSPAK